MVTDNSTLGALGQPLPIARIVAYAAPVTAIAFFYIPMWSILPGIYSKYFGLPLKSIAACVLIMRLFDGFLDMTIGYLSDWHHSRGGTRKSWVIAGCLGSVVACGFLFRPPEPATTAYYLGWSMVYFLFVTIAAIPHTTWGNELTLDYQHRARIFGIYNVLHKSGIAGFYALPLLPVYKSAAYTPAVLHGAVYVGGTLTLLSLAWALLAAPAGIVVKTVREDSLRRLTMSLIHNGPLLMYIAAFGCGGLCFGMWFGLLFFYLDSYLGIGTNIALMFLGATIISIAATPLCVVFIRRTSKSTAWAAAVLCFFLQLVGAWFVKPGSPLWMPCLIVISAHLCFSWHDTATWSMLGDIIDYGKLKFHKDRGATYCALYALVFKVGLGVGGGVSIGIASLYGFDPSSGIHSSAAILGLKLGFIVLPGCLALVGLFLILKSPINPRRHALIQRRLERRLLAT